jgi:hypothetical protein
VPRGVLSGIEWHLLKIEDLIFLMDQIDKLMLNTRGGKVGDSWFINNKKKKIHDFSS